MKTPWRGWDDDTTAMSNPECILLLQPPNCHSVDRRTNSRESTKCTSTFGCRITEIGYNTPESTRQREAWWQSRPAESEEGPNLKNKPTHSTSSVKLKNNVRKQIASTRSLVEDALIRFSGNGGRVKESSPDMKMISVMQTVVNRAFSKGFCSAAFYSEVQEAVHKCVPERQNVDAVGTTLVGTPFFYRAVATFVKNKV